MNHAKVNVNGQIMYFLVNRWKLPFQTLHVYTSHNAEVPEHCYISPCPRSQGHK